MTYLWPSILKYQSQLKIWPMSLILQVTDRWVHEEVWENLRRCIVQQDPGCESGVWYLTASRWDQGLEESAGGRSAQKNRLCVERAVINYMKAIWIGLGLILKFNMLTIYCSFWEIIRKWLIDIKYWSLFFSNFILWE